MRAAITRILGLWALACLIAAVVGATPVWAHGAHHHAPTPTAHAGDYTNAAPLAVSVARPAVATCQPARGAMHHDGCCTATGCCMAGCSGAVAVADAPALLSVRPASTSANPGLDCAGRETRPAEHPPRPTV